MKLNNLVIVVLIGLLVMAAAGPAYSSPASQQAWTRSGDLNFGRHAHSATLLNDGQVLVAGGYGSGSIRLSQTELYDPATGRWTRTGDLGFGRVNHTATLLPDGQVLVVGGLGSGGIRLVQTELYDPATGRWTRTGDLNIGREFHTSTLLPSGKVLVTGGDGSGGSYAVQAELYDPATGRWSYTGNLNIGRSVHTATLLPSGKVLVAGGSASGGSFAVQSELYDPASGSWIRTGSLNIGRNFHTATLLPNGKVLVAGGSGDGGFLNQAELYDPVSGSWSRTGDLIFGRSYHAATLLPDGQVLVAGGSAPVQAELYDPASGRWTGTGDLLFGRSFHTTTLLASGQVLAVGGYQMVQTELYGAPQGATLYLQHADGRVVAWSMDGSRRVVSSNLGRLSPGWQIKAVFDMDGDGHADLVCQHEQHGWLGVLFMEGNRIVKEEPIKNRNGINQVNPDWEIKAVYDLNNNGSPDIIWQAFAGSYQGQLAIWFMSGLQAFETGRLVNADGLPVRDPSWQLKAVHDLLGNGKPELIWQAVSGSHRGQLAYWTLDGYKRSGGGRLTQVGGRAYIDPAWQMMAIGDLLGNGRPELIWQRDDGAVAYWRMAGSMWVEGNRLNPSNVDPAWTIVGMQ